jgi:hypothetical protein
LLADLVGIEGRDGFGEWGRNLNGHEGMWLGLSSIAAALHVVATQVSADEKTTLLPAYGQFRRDQDLTKSTASSCMTAPPDGWSDRRG